MSVVSTTPGGGIPVTCFTGFLGAGKTTTILSVLKQLPKDYKVVLLKNEYGDVEVDSLLAKQGNITGVSEILNGCLCCTMVGLVENALIEIRDKFHPDRIIIESSGSAFPATLALQIRQLEPEGFKLDGVVTVIDCVNFKGYEDTSPSAKLQAKYTDLLLLNKHAEVSERSYDILMDALGELNDETPRIRISPDSPPTPEILFGLDTKLFEKSASGEEAKYWDGVGAKAGWHGDEVETRTIWSGGREPGVGGVGGAGGAKRKRGEGQGHQHGEGESCGCEGFGAADGETLMGSNGTAETVESTAEVNPISREELDQALSKLNFEIYRVKGLVRLSDASSRGYKTHILNWAFGRSDLTPAPEEVDQKPELQGMRLRLTIMGERGEVAARARRFAEAVGGDVK